MTGSNVQLYNGIALIATFFSCRLVYGTYQSVQVFSDIWAAVDAHPTTSLTLLTTESLGPNPLAFATETSTVPLWLAASYLASNMTLNGLNSYWFFMMIKAIRKRFVPPATEPSKGGPTTSAISSGSQATPASANRRKP